MSLHESISKKKAIVDVIVKLMDEEGMKNVTVKDICDNAHISVGAFYHYFNSKDSIIDEMYSVMDEFFINSKDSILNHSTTEEDIIDFVSNFGLFVEEWGYYANLLIMKASIDDAVNEKVRQRKNYDMLKDIILVGVEKKEFSLTIDVDDLVSTIFIIIRSHLLEWIRKGKDYEVRNHMVIHIKKVISSLI